jgi:AAA15 family ATPase/GTPase
MAKKNISDSESNSWMITDLKIENFKSIKHQELKCKKYNLFLGKPNVGKSNILEAISLLGGYNSEKPDKFFSDYIRYEKVSNLFYDNDRNLELLVKSNLGYVYSSYHLNRIDKYDFLFSKNDVTLLKLKELKEGEYNLAFISNGMKNITSSENGLNNNFFSYYLYLNQEGGYSDFLEMPNHFFGNIKKYRFKDEEHINSKFNQFLKPPYGNNTLLMLEANPHLFDEFASLFEQYGLDLLLDTIENKLDIQKKISRRTYKIPYALTADTLRRYLFHLLAIKTNRQSVILFEEPEAHCYPKYISGIAEAIIEDNHNQYFIATHSPLLLSDFIERCDYKDLAIFITDYVDYKTIYRELTEEEISNILNNEVDIFQNQDAFKV